MILAKKGSGKTCLAMDLAETWKGPRIVVDPACCLPDLADGRTRFVERWEVDSGLLPVAEALYVLDEVDLIAPSDVNLMRVCGGKLYDIVHLARHQGKGAAVIGTARRPANVRRDLTSQADRIFVGKLSEQLDLKYVADFAGKAAARHARQAKVGQFREYRT